MKKTVLSVGMILLSMQLVAGSFSWLTSFGSKEIPSKQVQLETNGNNVRVYKHFVKGVDGKYHMCVFYAADGGSGGASCDWSYGVNKNPIK